MAALRKLGVRCAVGFSAVGSLKEEVKPRDFVVVDQLIDWTKGVSLFTFHQIVYAVTMRVRAANAATTKVEIVD